MKDHKSQAGSETTKKSREEVKRKKGHMALRNNVYDLKLELWHILKPLEYYLVDVIIDKTIKWREKEARITIQELIERTKQADTHIYAALRNLKNKKVIIWEKQKHFSVYSLNEEFFGGLLIKRHEDALQKRRSLIRKIVDNTKKDVDTTDENCQFNRRDSSVVLTNDVSPSTESRQSEHTQDFEIIEEKRSLNTLLKDISLNTSLQSGETGNRLRELHSFSGSKKPQRTQEEHERVIKQQLAEMKANIAG